MWIGFRYLLALIFCGFGRQAYPQDISPKNIPPVVGAYPDVNLIVYRNAVALHDYPTAIHALHYIIAGNTGGEHYADTLAFLYVGTGQYLQAGLLADIQLSSRGYTDMRMEIKALSAKGLNDPVTAIASYKTLYEKTGNASFGFEKLQLEYSIKRLSEAIMTANNILSRLPANDTTSLQVRMEDNNRSTQSISLRAGILNIEGSIFIELNQKDDAIKALTSSLKSSPDFQVAKSNLKIANGLTVKKY